MEQLKAFGQAGRVDLVQNRFSMVHRRAYEEVVEYCRANDIYLNPYQVIERGLLTGRTSGPLRRRDGDLRSSKAEYMGEPYDIVRHWFVESIAPIAQELDIAPETLAIAWVCSQPQIALPVVGATSAAQVRFNYMASRVDLDNVALRRIEEAFRHLAEEVRTKYGLSVEDFRGVHS
jgi:aryl-alcohol dehydrogenase-like predicted oxidoreductase